MIKIDAFQDEDTNAIIDLVLHFQNDGTRPLVSVNDQPDLLSIKSEYFNKGGCFWVAKDDDVVVGSIGLMPYSDTIFVLKKFFVYEQYQGAPIHLGQRLYKKMMDFALNRGAKTILLDTPANTARAHKFYEKVGFQLIEEENLPIRFSHPYEQCDFFILKI